MSKDAKPVEIRHRYTGEIICSGETLIAAVEANRAYLRGANLRGANLRGANLRGANLRGANLRDANLRGANLRDANLRGANLGDANLRGAYLRGANLRDACLGGAKLSWQSHDLLAEILRRAAGDDTEKLKVAGLILVCREKCWSQFLELRDPLAGWALDELAGWVREGDDAPEVVRARAEQLAEKESAP